MRNNPNAPKNIILGVIILILIFGLFYFMMRQLKNRETYAIINKNIRISLELAQNDSARYLGLSDRKSLCQNCGMLFVWPDYAIRDFVMRDMNFPLDIIFISDQKIVKIESNLLPEGSNPENIYSSDFPSNYVLEINGGISDRFGIALGDEIIINLPK